MSAIPFVCRLALCAALLGPAFPGSASQPASGPDFQLEVKLIWGSNDETSPDPSHKKVDTEFTKWLVSNHYKWKHYFEVKAEKVKIPAGTQKTVTLSHGNSVEIKNVDGIRLETRLMSQSKPVTNVAKPQFPKGARLVLAGQDKNDSGWFVVIKNTGPK
jgi:hypothetical protein